MRLSLIIGCALLAGVCNAQTISANRGESATVAAAQLSGDLELRDSSGNISRLSDLRGTPVILNFWAAWCPPCLRELPWFVEIQKMYGSQGLRVVGITVDEIDNPEVTKVLAKAGVNYLVLFGSVESSLSYLGVQGLPVTLFIARDGRVLHKMLGVATRQELKENARELLK